MNKLPDKSKQLKDNSLQPPPLLLNTPPIPILYNTVITLDFLPPQPPPVEVSDVHNKAGKDVKIMDGKKIQSVEFWPLLVMDIITFTLFSLSPPPAYDPTDDVTDMVNIVKTMEKLFNLVNPDLISFTCPSCDNVTPQLSDLEKHVQEAHEARHRKQCKYVQGLVLGRFAVDPPQLDLDYLEMNQPVVVKKGGDIFDDVRHYRMFR
jgi:hypothetical protein